MDAKRYKQDYILKDDPAAEKEIYLRDYFRILRDRRSIIYTVAAVIMTFTVIFTFSRIPMYEASAKLIIEQSERNPLLSELGNLGSDPEFLAKQTEIIKSTAVGLKVVEMLNLDTTYDDYLEQQKYGVSLVGLRMLLTDWLKKAILTWMKIIGGAADAQNFQPATQSKSEKRATAERIAGKLSEEFSVRSAGDSGILTLSYLAPNPVLAGNIVNAAVEAYIEKNFDMKVEASNQTLAWMTAKADEEKANLERAERALQNYMEENDIVTIENRVTVTPQKLAEINSELIKTQGRRRELSLLYRRINELPPDLKGAESLQVIASDTAIQTLRSQILEAEKKIMDISKTYGPKHPVMKQAKADLQVLMQQRIIEIRRVMAAVKNDYDLILESEREYEKLLNETKQDTVKFNEKLIQYNILKREVETSRQLYNTLITRIKEQNLAEQAQSVKVWVIEKAKTPEYPAKPNKTLNIILGFALSLFIGITLAFLLEHLDDTIKYPDAVEDRLNLPLLGTVIRLETEKDAPEKATLENVSSDFSESFKSIRTAVLLSSASTFPMCMLVTGTAPSDGKTTATVNLAASMAQAGRQVLLIDADMRRPRIHKILELNNNKGLSSFLTGLAGIDIIQKSRQQNLDVITSGPIPPNPSELLISELEKKLTRLKQSHYDLIIFDSPPILTVSDGLILGKYVDSIILVARAGKTTWELIEKGRRALVNIGGKILGVIINGKDIKEKNYNYYYNHYYNSYKKDKY